MIKLSAKKETANIQVSESLDEAQDELLFPYKGQYISNTHLPPPKPFIHAVTCAKTTSGPCEGWRHSSRKVLTTTKILDIYSSFT